LTSIEKSFAIRWFLKKWIYYCEDSLGLWKRVLKKIPLLKIDLCITRRCEEPFGKLRTGSDEATQRLWIYPFGARKLRNIITATPLCGSP